MKRTLLALALVCALATPAHAVGVAGCGLGSLVFSKNSMIIQAWASWLNYIFGQQSSITSGTSNCKTSGFVFVEHEYEDIYFAEANIDRLRVEMAQGSGESLDGLAAVLGCDASGEMFGKMTKQNYRQIFQSTETTPFEVLESVRAQIKADPDLARACHLG